MRRPRLRRRDSHRFEGDWPTLLHAPSTGLRAVFLGDPERPESGIVALVGLGDVPGHAGSKEGGPATAGFILLSIVTDLGATLARLTVLGLGGRPRRIDVAGVGMAVVTDPHGVRVELVDAAGAANLDRVVACTAAPRQ